MRNKGRQLHLSQTAEKQQRLPPNFEIHRICVDSGERGSLEGFMITNFYITRFFQRDSVVQSHVAEVDDDSKNVTCISTFGLFLHYLRTGNMAPSDG